MFARTDTARGIQAIYRRFSRDPLLGPDEEPPLACHLVTPRTLYNHHGIYVGNGRVIHYAGLAHGLRRGCALRIEHRVIDTHDCSDD
jgi:Lecithin retinol acyltransferase